MGERTPGIAPLSGIRVVEVANWVAAPTATMMMAEFGAEVVKVEPLTGDGMRGLLRQAVQSDEAPKVDHPWQLENRGKRGVAVDLEDDRGVDLVHRLAAQADVFVTNLTPARQRRFRLDPDTLRAEHPELVHAVLTGFGAEGAEADKAGFDVTAFFARTSLAMLTSEPDGPPTQPRPGQGDHVAGLALLSGILLALRTRERTGQGDVVESSLIAAGAWTAASDLAAALVDGKHPRPKHRHDAVTPLVAKFETSDRRWLQLTMPGSVYWARLCAALDRPDLVEDERYADPLGRYRNRFELMPELDRVFVTRTAAEWSARLADAGCIFELHQTLDEFVDDPQAAAAGVFGEVDHPAGSFRTVRPPIRLRSQPEAVAARGPEIGEHSRAVLAEAGLDGSEIDALVEAGVVAESQAPTG